TASDTLVGLYCTCHERPAVSAGNCKALNVPWIDDAVMMSNTCPADGVSPLTSVTARMPVGATTLVAASRSYCDPAIAPPSSMSSVEDLPMSSVLIGTMVVEFPGAKWLVDDRLML